LETTLHEELCSAEKDLEAEFNFVLIDASALDIESI
jgi:hypothetical protein